ncbi:MAG: PDZ domain-containing protein [Planctomycetes bacterium]|nr:PDZ domain-containing protein [Planctomycetota bacterium]
MKRARVARGAGRLLIALLPLAALTQALPPVAGQDVAGAVVRDGPSRVRLAIASEPVDSAVFVRYPAEARDRFVGRTPGDGGALELELEPGPAELVIYKDGFVCKVEPLELRPGGAARLEVRLTPDIEVPRRVHLKDAPSYVRSATEGEEIFVAVLAHVVKFYVEEKHPYELVDRAVATLVDVLNAVRSRELLLRRELPQEARRRYYGEEVDLSGYPALAFTRGAPALVSGKRRWSLGAGAVAVEGETDPVDLDSYLDMLQKVYAFVRHKWDTRKLLGDAVVTHCLIEGLIAGLDDDHTHFLSPKDVAEMARDQRGAFGGVGLIVGLRDGRLTVITPMSGTPGQRAGIRAGDVIEAIDGQDTSRMTMERAVDLMRGKVDAPVELRLRRGDQSFTVSVLRANVEIRSVAYRMLGEGVGYLRISSFMNEALHEKVEAALVTLTRQGCKGLVLDLRNNPGGLLEEARAVADLFVPDGVIVSTRTRMAGEARTLRADPGASKWKLPVVVLINGGSASASEILAGALREHRLATLVGEKTFGKGSVQRVLPLDPFGCAIALTIATYHLPSGATPHKVGIEPDVVVPLDDEAQAKLIGRTPYTLQDEEIDAQLEAAIGLVRERMQQPKR